MKKLVVAGLCAALCFQLVACGSAGGTQQAADASALIGTDLESGKMLIDGKEYVFPDIISNWTSDGWHISNSYANTDTFELEYLVESNEFEVFNDEKESEYVSMCAINLGTEPSKIEESTTSYLDVHLTGGKKGIQVALPGGIGRDSSEEDVIAAYGEPALEEDGDFYYFYTNADDLDVVVRFSFDANGAYKVVYSLAETNWGFVANAQECAEFIDNALKTSFYGDYADYVETKFDTEEGAIELYEVEIQYYAEGIMYFLGIDYETVAGEIADGYYDIAKEVLGKFKWDEPVVDLPEGSTYGSFELTMYPTDFLDIMLENEEVIAIADDESIETLDEYAQKLLDAVTPLVDQISYKEPITKTYNIDINDTIVSSDDWNNIDDVLMDLAEQGRT